MRQNYYKISEIWKDGFIELGESEYLPLPKVEGISEGFSELPGKEYFSNIKCL